MSDGDLSLWLSDFGPNRLSVIKEMRAVLGIGASEAMRLATELPTLLAEGVSGVDAVALSARFEQLGATVEVTDAGRSESPEASCYGLDSFQREVVEAVETMLSQVVDELPRSRSVHILVTQASYWPELLLMVNDDLSVNELKIEPSREGSDLPWGVDAADAIFDSLTKRFPELSIEFELTHVGSLFYLLFRVSKLEIAEAVLDFVFANTGDGRTDRVVLFEDGDDFSLRPKPMERSADMLPRLVAKLKELALEPDVLDELADALYRSRPPKDRLQQWNRIS